MFYSIYFPRDSKDPESKVKFYNIWATDETQR